MEKLQVGDIVRFKLEAWNVSWVRENYANASYRVGRVTDLMVSLVRLDDVSEHETACAVPMDYLELVPIMTKRDTFEALKEWAAPSMEALSNDPLEKQEGGNHYKSMKIQPVEFIHANDIPFIEGCIIKYAARWRNKGGISDLKKIIHFAEVLISLEEKRNN